MTNWIERLEASDEGRRLIEQERLLFEATETIYRLMSELGISKKSLADGLNRSPAFVTKLLRGDNNFTLRTLADVLGALGHSMHIELAPLGDQARIPEFSPENRVLLRPSFSRCAFDQNVFGDLLEPGDDHPVPVTDDAASNSGYAIAA